MDQLSHFTITLILASQSMPNLGDKFVLNKVRFSQGLSQFKGIDILIYHEHHKLMGPTKSEDKQDILV
jgi:hypothetical protein